MRKHPRNLRRTNLSSQRIRGGLQPGSPIFNGRVVAKHCASLTLCQPTPHAKIGFGLQGVSKTFQTDLALQTTQAYLALRSPLNK